jgi:hypothetical protein
MLVACASAGTREVSAATETNAQLSRPARGSAYGIVMQATSCWMGGLWGDALGEKEEDRPTGIQQRCEALLRSEGESPEGAYYPLRALDPATVDHLARRVAAVAMEHTEERSDASELTALLLHIADAARETIHARRAADKVKADVLGDALSGEYRADKIAASPELTASASLHALLHAQVGPYDTEAQIVGLLSAVDRMEIARGLPKHLKIYAVAGAYRDVFGVSAPVLPENAAAAITKGTWLGYAAEVAAAALHPVPSGVQDPRNREPLAWNGILEGYADKLRALEADLPPSTQLGTAAHAIVARLDGQYASQRALSEDDRLPR